MKYFAYGMNTNIQSMGYRCPRAVLLGKSFLLGHEFRFAHHADVVVKHGSVVEGVLWEITKSCLENLDALEGYPYYYDRKSRPVKFNDYNILALVYVMQPGNKASAPSQGYLDMLEQGYRENKLDGSQLSKGLSVFELS